MVASPKLMRAARVPAGLTQQQLAKKAGVSKAAVNRIEVGDRSSRLSTFDAVQTALSNSGIRFLIATDDILEGIGVARPRAPDPNQR